MREVIRHVPPVDDGVAQVALEDVAQPDGIPDGDRLVQSQLMPGCSLLLDGHPGELIGIHGRRERIAGR